MALDKQILLGTLLATTLSWSELMNISYLLGRDMYHMSDDSFDQKSRKFLSKLFNFFSGGFLLVYTIEVVKDCHKLIKC